MSKKKTKMPPAEAKSPQPGDQVVKSGSRKGYKQLTSGEIAQLVMGKDSFGFKELWRADVGIFIGTTPLPTGDLHLQALVL